MKHKGQPPQSSHCGEKGEWEGKERSERSGRKKKEGEEAPASPRSSRHGEPTFNAGPNSSFLPRRSGLSSLFPACSRAPQAQQPGRPPPSPGQPRSGAGAAASCPDPAPRGASSGPCPAPGSPLRSSRSHTLTMSAECLRWWMSHRLRVCTLCCELLSSDSFRSSATSENADIAAPR